MKRYECKKCHKLLLKHYSKFGSVEIYVKCPKCKAINKVTISQMLGIKVDDFAKGVETVHCEKCGQRRHPMGCLES